MPPRITALMGDITTQDVDAVVNAANSAMAPGGGVCGAIAAAAGSEIFSEAAAEARRLFRGRVPPGEAVITGAGRMRARWVVHAVGPVYDPREDRSAQLRSAYRRSLDLAAAVGARSIAFPAISAGIYGWPGDDAARQAVAAVRAAAADPEGQAGHLDEVRFVLFSSDTLADFETALSS